MPFQNSLSSNHYFCFAVAHKHNPTCRSTRRYTVYNTVKCFTFRLLMIWPRHLTIYLNKNDKLTVLSGFIKGSHLCSSKEGEKSCDGVSSVLEWFWHPAHKVSVVAVGSLTTKGGTGERCQPLFSFYFHTATMIHTYFTIFFFQLLSFTGKMK